MRHSLFVVILAVVGCATGGPSAGQPDAAAHPDGPIGPGIPDAPVGSSATGPLLLTEIVLAPSTAEFIEIANPGATTVDLSTYYLADGGPYFRLPAGVPVMDAGDFIVKFPAGATIAPRAVITVAVDTVASFTTAYGAAPTYAIAGTASKMTSIANNGVESLTNAGEVVILFEWNGQTDLVRDVDILLAGVPTVANSLVNKNGVAIDGPDPGTTTSTYANDARTLAAQSTAPAAGKSTKRTGLEAGHEIEAGTGNGITGDDETSEDVAATWDSVFTAPTPGTVPPALLP